MKKDKLKIILYFLCMFYLFLLVFFSLFVVGKLFVININPCLRYFPDTLEKSTEILNSTKTNLLFKTYLKDLFFLLKSLNSKLSNIENNLNNYNNKTIKVFCNTTCICLNNFNLTKEKNNEAIKKVKRKIFENKRNLNKKSEKNCISNFTFFPKGKILKIKVIKFYENNKP